MAAVNRVLIIGGGFSGMSAAIELRKRGVQVDIAEIDPGWRSYGAGISLGGAALRAFRMLGVLDEFLRRGAASDGVDVFLANGARVTTLPTPRVAGADVPGGGAILRPVLTSILADATRASGANVRLGCSFNTIEQDADGVDVGFTDGTSGRYDLVIGADGLYSKVRGTLFPEAPQPKYSGQGVWRAVLPRPPEVERAAMWLGENIKTGVNPVSVTEMYLFVTENRAENTFIDPSEFVSRLKGLLAPFPAPLMQTLREQLDESSHVIFRPLETLLLAQPWNRGRVVLIGDAVHATTPHMASGACIGIEDALVLADELEKATDVGVALQAFQARRWERCRMVVENSARLGEIEIVGGDKQEHSRIMRETMMSLAKPISAGQRASMMDSMRSLFSLRGKVAVVTGAAQGLGRSIAEAMAAQGASVVLADLDANACEATASELREDGGDVLAVSCDVSDLASLGRLAEIARGWRGGIDILVCNAGIQGPAGPLAQASDADWDRVFAVNLRGAARLADRLLPVMAGRGGGSVVLISSIAGLRGNRAIGLYGMSKAALSQLARNLAVEWGPQGIRVNAIAPGLIRTPLAVDLLACDEFMARRLAMTPLRRVGEPHEVAGVAVLLAGKGGAFITGQTLVVDGGTLITD